MNIQEKFTTTNDIQEAVPKLRLWASRIISGLLVAFFIFDGVAKVLLIQPVVEGSAALGLPAHTTAPIGWLLLIITAIFVIPRTRVLGAILLTGYLGGATAVHVRADDGTFPLFFSVGIGVLVWAALVLRDRPMLGVISGSTQLSGARINSPVFEE